MYVCFSCMTVLCIEINNFDFVPALKVFKPVNHASYAMNTQFTLHITQHAQPW